MPFDEEVEDNEVEEPNADVEKAEAEQRIAERLEGVIESKTENAKVLGQLMADPDIRRIFEAKQKGEKISFSTSNEESKEDEEEPDYENMTQAQLHKHLLSSVKKSVDQSVNTRLEPVINELSGFRKFVESQESNSVTQQITEARKEYGDFDTYKDNMIDIHKANPGLSVKELYLLSKVRKLGPESLLKRPETEKPSGSVLRKKKERVFSPGSQGFEEMLDSATENMVED